MNLVLGDKSTPSGIAKPSIIALGPAVVDCITKKLRGTFYPITRDIITFVRHQDPILAKDLGKEVAKVVLC